MYSTLAHVESEISLLYCKHSNFIVAIRMFEVYLEYKSGLVSSRQLVLLTQHKLNAVI